MQKKLRVHHSGFGTNKTTFTVLELVSEWSLCRCFTAHPVFFSILACNKTQQCSGGSGQCVTHSLGTKHLCGSRVDTSSPGTALHAFPLESNLQGNEVRDGDGDDNSK